MESSESLSWEKSSETLFQTGTLTSKNANSSNNTSITNNNTNNIRSNNNNSSDSNTNNNDRMNVIINETDNVRELHVGDLIDSEYKLIIEEKDTNSAQLSSNSDVRNDSEAKLIISTITMKNT